jgi:hypothetical protein
VRYRILLAALVICLAADGLNGQSAPGVQQVLVQWTTPVAGPAPLPPGQEPANPLKLLDRRPAEGSLPRQRHPQLSEDQVLVQAFNAGGALVDSHLIPDPRLVRAEFAGPTGELTGEVLNRLDPEFLITLPDLPGLVELRLFKPRWTGTAFALDLIGTINLR